MAPRRLKNLVSESVKAGKFKGSSSRDKGKRVRSSAPDVDRMVRPRKETVEGVRGSGSDTENLVRRRHPPLVVSPLSAINPSLTPSVERQFHGGIPNGRLRLGQNSSPAMVWKRVDSSDSILNGSKAIELHKVLLLDADMVNRRKLDDSDLFISSLQLAEQLVQQIHVMNERGSLATGGMISAKEKYAKTSDAMKIMSDDINNLQKEVFVLKENLQESRKKEDDQAASADWQQKRADRYKSRSLEVEAKLESLRKEMEELKKTVQEKEDAAENRGFEEAELQAAAQIKTHKALAFKQGWNEALGAANVDPGSELFLMHVVSPLHEDQDVDSPGVDFGVDQAHQIGDDCGEGGPEAAATGGTGSGIVEAEPITQDNVPADV